MNNRAISDISLTYVITTRNKLPYLKEVMKRLLENVRVDEEIVVADGVSTDGTVEYLKDLHEQGKIHQFISEPDKGEAHGYNKALLMARGELIKLITDDDAFYYPGIQECKRFMLENKHIDVISGNTAQIMLERPGRFKFLAECQNNYQEWLNHSTSGWFIGLPLMIRKQSLSLTGLFSTGFIQVDTEYSLRITSLNHVNIAWHMSVLAVRIENPKSNFRSFSLDRKSFEERDRMWYFFSQSYRNNLIAQTKKEFSLLEFLKKQARPIKINIETLLNRGENKKNENQLERSEILVEACLNSLSEIENAFSTCDNFFEEFNSKDEPVILYKHTA